MNYRLVAIGFLSGSLAITACKDDSATPAQTTEVKPSANVDTIESKAVESAETITAKTETVVETAKKSVKSLTENLEQTIEKLTTVDFSEFESQIKNFDKEILNKAADKFRVLIDENLGKLSGLESNLKEFNFTDLLGPKAKELKGQISTLTTQIDDYKKRFDVIYNQLKDLGLEIKSLGK